MSTTIAISPPLLPAADVPSPDKALRQLFLTLFLRGRSSRGLNKKGTPKSVGRKLIATLFMYAAIGATALILVKQPVFALSIYAHAMTFAFLGIFVASSAGEILFNNEEADILLHRPISAKALLRAKMRILVEVSLWLGLAFNLAALCAGPFASNGDWRFPLVHVLSTSLEAIFCVGCVVLIYQLCLRWFGRERLNGLMTTAQVLGSIAAILCSQFLPGVVFRSNHLATFNVKSWWIVLLPPGWFAGIDDALAGAMTPASWLLAAIAVIATATVLFLAFGKLARDYGMGLQRLSESAARPGKNRSNGRWLDRFTDFPPLRWWLGDQVSRASFLLTIAYLIRDRDVKLRVYPAMASLLIMPFIFMMQSYEHHVTRGAGGFGTGGGGGMGGGFGIAFASAYMGVIPLFGLNLLQYSQQWQASDIFRAAPMLGPAPLFHGARRALLIFLALPLMVLLALAIWILDRNTAQLPLLLPGLITIPVFALLPGLGGKAVPLSLPTEEAKSARRGVTMLVAIVISMIFAGIVAWSWYAGWFWWLVLIEAIIAAGVYGFCAISWRRRTGRRWNNA